MTTPRRVIWVSLAVLLALAGIAHAAGKPKAQQFKPAIDEYVGTATTEQGKKLSALATVAKEKGKYYVQVIIQTTASCTDGTTVVAGVGLMAPLHSRSFNLTESGSDSRTGGSATWKMKGSFSATRSFSGVGSKEIVAPSATCTTGQVSFNLHRK